MKRTMTVVLSAIAVVVTITACSSGDHAHTSSSSDVYVKAFNGSVNGVGPQATSSSDKRALITDGKAFCSSLKQTSNVNTAKQHVVDSGVSAQLAGFIVVAATNTGSLCPVK